MKWRLPAMVLVAVLASACSGSEPGAAPTPETSSASPRYIDPADTVAINQASAASRDAAVIAIDGQAMRKCNALADWRHCYRELVDPYVAALETQAAELEALSGGEYEPECVTALQDGVRLVRRASRRVSGIAAAWESDDAKRQAAATANYDKIIRKTLKTSQQVLVDVTPPCFSPDAIESAEAAASSSPTSSE